MLIAGLPEGGIVRALGVLVGAGNSAGVERIVSDQVAFVEVSRQDEGEGKNPAADGVGFRLVLQTILSIGAIKAFFIDPTFESLSKNSSRWS